MKTTSLPLALSLLGLSAACTPEPLPADQAAAVTAERILFAAASEPGTYSFFSSPLPDGGVWLEGNVTRQTAQRATWSGSKLEVTRSRFAVPDDATYLLNFAERTLRHTDGPLVSNRPARVFVAGGEYDVRLCQEPNMRCGQGAMQPTSIGILLGAAAGPSYDSRTFSLRWLGRDAAQDVHVVAPPQLHDDFLVGVTSVAGVVLGAYSVKPAQPGERRFVPFSFEASDPAATFREGPTFASRNGATFPQISTSVGVADGSRYRIYLPGDTLRSYEFDWRAWRQTDASVHPIYAVQVANGSYGLSPQGENVAMLLEPRSGGSATFWMATPQGVEELWKRDLSSVKYEASGERLGDALFVSDNFTAVGEYGGLVYLKSGHSIVAVDPSTREVARAWTVAADLASTTFEMPVVWAARIFGDELVIMGIKNINQADAQILLAKIDLR